VLAAAALGEVEHHGLHGVEPRGAVAPQVRAVRLAKARLEHRHRRLVGVQHVVAAQLGAERLGERLQLHAALADPLRQRRARDRQTGAAKDLLLPVQWQVVLELRHQHLGEQAAGRDPLVDHVRRDRRLHQRLALRADPLAADVPLDREQAGRVVELLGDVLADAPQLTAATAGGALGLVADLPPRQLGRQRLALRRLLLGRPGTGLSCSISRASEIRKVGVDGLLEQALLLGRERFALRGELQPLEHGHLVRELVDGR
jgi:hypothetical protein